MLKEQLVNALLWNENEAVVKRLEEEASLNDIFEMDNGKRITRKENESLGNYIDRCTTQLMRNFSREKYIILKNLYKNYNNSGDSNVVIYESSPVQKRPKKDYKKQIALSIGALIAGAAAFKLFKNKNK